MIICGVLIVEYVVWALSARGEQRWQFSIYIVCCCCVCVACTPVNVSLESSILGTDIIARVQKEGLDIDPVPLIRLRAVILGAGLVWAIAAGIAVGINGMLLPVALALIGWKLVDNYVNGLQKKRQEEIAREFPLFVNMIRVFSKASDLYIAINTSGNYCKENFGSS